jgi:hypothetical protein
MSRRIRHGERLARFYAHRWTCLIRYWKLPGRSGAGRRLHLGVQSN